MPQARVERIAASRASGLEVQSSVLCAPSLRWTAAGLLEAQKTFRRLKAYRQLPILDAALREAVRKAGAKSVIEDIEVAA